MTDQTLPSTSDRMEDIDTAVEAEINPDPPQPDAMNIDGGNDVDISTTNGVTDGVPAQLESRIPAKKDTTLREFLGKMDDYAPIVSPVQVASLNLVPMLIEGLDPGRSN